jgi:hypothetical protein
MSFTYDETLATDLDIARFTLGDTDSANVLLSNEHITATIALYTPLNVAVALMAEGLAARYAQKPSSVGLPSGLSVSWSERVKFWLNLAKRLRETGSITGASTAFSVPVSRTDGYSAYADEVAG